MRHQPSRASLVAAVLMLAVVAGCGSIIDSLTGAYGGPLPDRENVQAETAIVRHIDLTEGRIGRLLLDRTRFVDAGDPHDVNRVIDVVTGPAQAQAEALDPQVGDRVVVSTEFFQIGEIADDGFVPNWPGHKYVEFPIGEHRLTAISGANP